MELKIQFDEEKLKEIVEEAVNKLKREGYIWRDDPKPFDWSKWSERDPTKYIPLDDTLIPRSKIDG